MKLKKLFLFGAFAIFCAACSNNKSGDSDKSESFTQLNLEFWPTFTDDEIAQFVLPKLETVIMNETGDESLAGCFYPSNGIVAAIKCEDKPTVDGIIAKAKDVLPKNVILLWSAKPLVEKYSPYDDTLYEKYYLYAIKDYDSDGIAPLQGDILEEAVATFNRTTPVIFITMKPEAAAIWSDMTAECAKDRRSIAVVVDGLVYSAPMPYERITGGRTEISGNFTIEDAKELVEKLK